jgi:hypothetical protein
MEWPVLQPYPLSQLVLCNRVMEIKFLHSQDSLVTFALQMMIATETLLATIASVYPQFLMDNHAEVKELEFVLLEHSAQHLILVITQFRLEVLVQSMVRLGNVDLCQCASLIWLPLIWLANLCIPSHLDLKSKTHLTNSYVLATIHCITVIITTACPEQSLNHQFQLEFNQELFALTFNIWTQWISHKQLLQIPLQCVGLPLMD